MLLAAPASADDASRGSGGPETPAITKPRLDLNGNGDNDLIYRGVDGGLYVKTGPNTPDYPFRISATDEREMHKDIIAMGDLNADGPPEIVTLSATGTLTLYPSAGEERTSPATWSGDGWQKYNKILSPGDLTGDGRNDLLARTPSGDVYLHASTGAIKGEPFAPAVKVASGWETYDQIVGLNDSNGDGFGDVVTRTTGGDLYFFAGTGDAAKPFKTPTKRIGYGFGIYNQLVGVDDLNGDGHGDLMGRKPNGDTYIYRSTGQGGFRTRAADAFDWQKAALFVGQGGNPDFGKHEAVGTTDNGSSWWYDSRNNGQFYPRSFYYTAQSGLTRLVSSLDVDGRAELLQVQDGRLTIGNHSFGSGWGAYDDLIGPGDLSGDGKGDLLARDTKGDLYLYPGNGLTEFGAKIKVGYGYGAYRHIVGAGDLTDDGRTDVVAVAKDGTLYLYAGTGQASAPLKARVKIGSGFDIYNKFAAPGDINGDGRADLIGVNGYGDLYRYTSTGTGTISKRVRIGYGFNIYNGLY
ncbi:VCBS repeat-containing protein [Streptomyces sp. NBC_01789]|uniref:FG-GAP repeat domain-containing protein n=1 Tax=Streptomyces sp. NBC_01789 TaxID=2975941 RepID=UPI0022528873|nr:VCBS repeat-containing protein [Streptomyces sp. NBC_01789]MCX4447711.1 VCBS repeat-containing protein [Streptomyces sp. NBC_01789]